MERISTGELYIPRFKLDRILNEVEDKSSEEYQRLNWYALKKSINGIINRVTAENIVEIIKTELFAENLIRGRGLFCRSIMKSQMAFPKFTDVFAALVSVVNAKFPEIGSLLLKRVVLQLKSSYRHNNKAKLLASVKFIAHLVNQLVVDEVIALELLTLLLENPTDDSVEVAVGFVTECGALLQDLCPKGLNGVFERFRDILYEGDIDKRVEFLIQNLLALRRSGFRGYPAVRPELDLVELEDQTTHEVSLFDDDGDINPECHLDVFQHDPNFLEKERQYENLKWSILGESEAETDESDGDSELDEEESDEEELNIQDTTDTNVVNLRKTIYLTIMSCVGFEEAGHKLMQIKLNPGEEIHLCEMLIECCSQEKTYLRYYGLLGERFCKINKVYRANFEACFEHYYSMIHRLETNQLRNVAQFFAQLLAADALPWNVLSYIRLTEEDTTSSSRIFLKFIFLELSEHLGVRRLNERLMEDSFESIFPKDNLRNTRFSINFFTSIGLGGLTGDYLKNRQRMIMRRQKTVRKAATSSSSSDDSESECYRKKRRNSDDRKRGSDQKRRRA